MIHVIYHYETQKGERYLFGTKLLKSHKGSTRTKIYKQLRPLLNQPDVRTVTSRFCYSEQDFNDEMAFLRKGGKHEFKA